MNQELLVELLEVLVTNNSINIHDCAVLIGESEERVEKLVKEINSILVELKLPLVVIKQQHIIVNAEIVLNKKKVFDRIVDTLFVQKEIRLPAIILMTYVSNDWLSVVHYEQLLSLSRNTVLNELKETKQKLLLQNITFKYNRSQGYFLEGKEDLIRNAVEHSLNQLLNHRAGKTLINQMFTVLSLQNNVLSKYERISKLAERFNITFVLERYNDIVYLIELLQHKKESIKIDYDLETTDYFKSTKIYELSRLICKEFNLNFKNEGIYLTIRLVSAVEGSQYLIKDENLNELASSIIGEVDKLMLKALNPQDIALLHNTLYEHLVPAYFRMKYGIPIFNPYAQTIKDEYSDLYNLVEKALSPLEQTLNKKIPESEIAYFTIHFGGYLKRKTDSSKTKRLRAITVCPNGISSSLLLNAQLESMFSQIDFLGIRTINEVATLDNFEFDMIFSTIHFETKKELFVTKPIMNWVEKEVLKKQVNQVFNLDDHDSSLNIKKILKVIEKHAEGYDEKALEEDLIRSMFSKNRERERKDLKDLLKLEMIQFTDKKLTWREAIKLAAEPLLNQGYIAEQYITAMISKVEELGPYIVLAPKVAIPHARAEDGAKKIGISLLHCENPVLFDFKDESPEEVNLIFVLSAIDNTSHLKALQQLAYLLEDDDRIEELIAFKNKNDIYSYIEEVTRKEEDND